MLRRIVASVAGQSPASSSAHRRLTLSGGLPRSTVEHTGHQRDARLPRQAQAKAEELAMKLELTEILLEEWAIAQDLLL